MSTADQIADYAQVAAYGATDVERRVAYHQLLRNAGEVRRMERVINALESGSVEDEQAALDLAVREAA